MALAAAALSPLLAAAISHLQRALLTGKVEEGRKGGLLERHSAGAEPKRSGGRVEDSACPPPLRPHSSISAPAGSWELRCAAAQGLAKIAARSREPYRIQCYAALAATQQQAVPGGAGGGGVDVADHMGLAAVVRPALEVLDAMYAGMNVVGLGGESVDIADHMGLAAVVRPALEVL